MKFSTVLAFVTVSVVSVSAGSIVARQGGQFITGPCKSDAECAKGCCGFNTGKCAGAVIALTRDGGCGFGATPNSNAAKQQGFAAEAAAFDGKQGGGGGKGNGAAAGEGKANGAAGGAAAGGANNAAAPAAGAGAGGAKGSQFITGPCKSDSECALGCCGFNTGKCAGAVIALTRDGGCGFGAKPNADAAKAQGFAAEAAAFEGKQGGKRRSVLLD